jgi:aminodeoxyfutalosine deaminase
VQDRDLVDYLVEHRIPLEVCPTSNIATRSVDTLANHPVRELYDAGVLVTVNSDDPPMFGTTLNREYEITADLLGLDERGIVDLARNAVQASFMPPEEQAGLLTEIDSYGERAVTPSDGPDGLA